MYEIRERVFLEYASQYSPGSLQHWGKGSALARKLRQLVCMERFVVLLRWRAHKDSVKIWGPRTDAGRPL